MNWPIAHGQSTVRTPPLRNGSKMTAHAPLFSCVSSHAVCEWMLEGENEASFSPNFKPSMDGIILFIKTLKLRQSCFRSEPSKAAHSKWPLIM